MTRAQPAPDGAVRTRWLWIATGLLVAQTLTWSGRLDGARRGRGDGPTTVTLDLDSGRVLAGFWNSRTIEAVEPGDPAQRAVVAAGHRPTQLGWLARSRALVFACYYEDHVCVVPLGAVPGSARCFVPDHGAGASLAWRRSTAGHATFPHPQGSFHGHVESFAVDQASERIYVLAGHFDGIGLDKDSQWLVPLRWDGDALVADGEALIARSTSHDHDSQPLALDRATGSLWWTSPSEREVRRIEPDGMFEVGRSGVLGHLPVAMAIDPRRRLVWIGDGVRPELRAIDADTLMTRIRVDAPAPVSALAFDDASGDLWVVSRGSDSIAILESGANEVRPFAELGQPSAAVFDPVRRTLWVTSLGDGGIHRFPARAVGPG